MTKKSVLRRLREVKKDIPNNSCKTNYNNIYNVCNEIDNEVCGLNLLDRFYEQDFIESEEDEKIAIEQNSDSFDRLRCFIGDTYSADVYRLDGYGNLANVSDGDFENICDDLMRIVEQNYVEEDEMWGYLWKKWLKVITYHKQKFF